jgi:hypothetical protein
VKKWINRLLFALWVLRVGAPVVTLVVCLCTLDVFLGLVLWAATFLPQFDGWAAAIVMGPLRECDG